jgi:hypothetical protein
MARDIMIWMRANPLQGSLEGVDPENRDFFALKWLRGKRVAIWDGLASIQIISKSKHHIKKKTGTLVIFCKYKSSFARCNFRTQKVKKYLFSGPTPSMALVMDLSNQGGRGLHKVYLLRTDHTPPPPTPSAVQSVLSSYIKKSTFFLTRIQSTPLQPANPYKGPDNDNSGLFL